MAKLNEGEKYLAAAVPEDLHKQVRIRAIEEGRPLTRLVEQAIRDYLARVSEEAIA